MQQLNEQGNSLVKQMKVLQIRINQFNQKYIAQVEEKKKNDGVTGFFAKQKNFIKKIGGTSERPSMKDNEEAKNISGEQLKFQGEMSMQNMQQLLNEQIELGSKHKKKFKE